MADRNFDLNNLRVAKPCHVGWDSMSGDERTRLCHTCKINVYNISEMTEAEISSLILNTEERICGRIFRRADGTVITKDCPIGLREFYKRTARFAGATLTTILALFSFGVGQNQSKEETACKRAGRIFRTESRNLYQVEGTILDQSCQAIPDAKITFLNRDTNRNSQVKSNKKGYYSTLLIAPGRYKYKVEANGFMSYTNDLQINSNESIHMDIILDVGDIIGVIEIVDQESKIDLKSSGVTTRVTRDILNKFPR